MEPDVHRLLTDAQAWHLLGRLLERPREGWHARVWALAEGLEKRHGEIHEAAALASMATEGRYLASFGPSGVVSPREVAHCGVRDPGQLLADLETRYAAFAYVPASEDPIDHVAVEADFVSYLRLKEAFARSAGDVERAAIAAEAADAFIADHLREMGAPIADRLEEAAEPYLARAARALARRVGSPTTSQASKIVWLEDESSACGNDVM